MRHAIIDSGEGPPLVVVPGVQGHWEWMRPAITALSARFRVVSYSLAGERSSQRALDASATFETLVDQLDELVESHRLDRPVICGISYGGLVALHYAARRPDRVHGLALVSAPSPRWQPDERLARYCRTPHLFAPLFAFQALRRMLDELSVTFPAGRDRFNFMTGHVPTVLRRPLSPSRASRRVKLIRSMDFVADCRRLQMPVLIVTGERSLDRVVPVEDTLQYRSLISHAQTRTVERTGHLGCITRPDRFAEILADFHASAGTDSAGSGVSAHESSRAPVATVSREPS